MESLVRLEPGSGIPLYMQLVTQLRRSVELGELSGGQRLPTVREMAGTLGVAPNTVVKAYGELRRMGLVESRPGVGTVVVDAMDEDARGRRLEGLYDRVREIVREARALGITEDDLWDRFSAEFERLSREG